MSDLALLLAFMGAAAALTLTPGVDTALVLRAALVQGRCPAALAALGIGLGCLAWGGCVALGLGALLQASEWAYTALRLAGAAYLVGTGARLLLKPRSAMSAVSAASDEGTGEGVCAAGSADEAAEAFRRGLLTNLLNPKVGVFYLSFLPQFVPSGASVAIHTFALAGIHVALSLAWFAVLIVATAPLQEWLRRPVALRALDRLAGCVFLVFGIRLAVTAGP
jgi:threonine/homoserine/homoserine lactone efflux protein